MKKDAFKLSSALVIIALIFILACAANTPYIVGKWKEIGKTATLEFWKDGTFKAVDNQKITIKGKYTLIEPGNVKFEIFRQDSPPEIVNETVSLQGDVLTFTSSDGKEFIEMTKDRLGYRAKGRKVVKSCEDYQLREQQASYIANSGHKKVTLRDDNTYLWDVSILN